jgi:hypothetical protein
MGMAPDNFYDNLLTPVENKSLHFAVSPATLETHRRIVFSLAASVSIFQ